MDKLARHGMSAVLALTLLVTTPGSTRADDTVSERFMRITRGTKWQLAATIPIRFVTHHPQGMVKIGERSYVSSVEITERTQRFPEPRDGLDRTPGEGAGHLFELDLGGNLLRRITLREGDAYHPGGIDYDGR